MGLSIQKAVKQRVFTTIWMEFLQVFFKVLYGFRHQRDIPAFPAFAHNSYIWVFSFQEQ